MNLWELSSRLLANPPPRSHSSLQRIGQDVYDLAFIMDADGVLLELLHHKLSIDTVLPPAW